MKLDLFLCQTPFTFFCYLFNAVVCEVHQLVPLEGDSPDISHESDVLHWKDPQVLYLYIK